MPEFSLQPGMRRRLWYILLLLLVVRLVTMAVVPLTDTTEARYGEIARKMLETDNWVTPQYDYGIPFWAKPPLSTWVAAASEGVFGTNEFGARFPSLLLGLGMILMIASLGKRRHGTDFALLASTILAGLPLFLVAAGAVMTDASLAFSATISFWAFWMAIKGEGKHWGYIFWIGQGVGLLAKGPVCCVLTFTPLFLWTWARGNWRQSFAALPWLRGILLMLLIGAPWYILAEHRTPGFIKYFIVGEHIKRFLISGWKGDKYGHAHSEPLGMIWIMWLGDTLPWSFIGMGWLASRFKRVREYFRDQDGWAMYLFWWSITPMLFFTMAHNILWTYTITGLPAFALLFTELWRRHRIKEGRTEPMGFRGGWMWPAFGISPLASVIVATIIIVAPDIGPARTQKPVAEKYFALRETPESRLVYFLRRYYSAEFYTAGIARHTKSRAALEELLHNGTRDFIALQKRDMHDLPANIRQRFEKCFQWDNIILLEEKTPIEISNTEPGSAIGARASRI